MRLHNSHIGHTAHAQQQPPRGGGGVQGGQPAAARAPQDTFQGQSSQAAYQQISGALAGDPAAQQALRQMLASGKLDGRMMDQLGRLAQPGGDTALLGQVVKDVANPGSIRQGRGNQFCAATTALSDLAAGNPAEYARMAADLRLTGQSRTAGGQTIRAQGGSPQGMTATQQLMAPALTEQANGRRYDVNNQGVSHAANPRHAPHGERRLNGTVGRGMERMQEMLQGGNFETLYIPGRGEGGGRGKHGKGGGGQAGQVGNAAGQAQNVIARSVAGGQQASVSADGHWYRVTGASGGQLTLQDQATGQSSTVNARQFLRGAEAVTFAGGAGQVGKNFRKPGNDEDEGGHGGGRGSLTPPEDAL